MPCAESNTICARRHVTTDPDARRTIRSSRLPSALVISRNCTLAAKSAPSRRAIPAQGFDGQGHEPCYVNPANVAGASTSSNPAEALGLLAHAEHPRGDPGADRVRGQVLGDDRAGPDHRVVADGDAAQDAGAVADPAVVA